MDLWQLSLPPSPHHGLLRREWHVPTPALDPCLGSLPSAPMCLLLLPLCTQQAVLGSKWHLQAPSPEAATQDICPAYGATMWRSGRGRRQGRAVSQPRAGGATQRPGPVTGASPHLQGARVGGEGVSGGRGLDPA